MVARKSIIASSGKCAKLMVVRACVRCRACTRERARVCVGGVRTCSLHDWNTHACNTVPLSCERTCAVRHHKQEDTQSVRPTWHRHTRKRRGMDGQLVPVGRLIKWKQKPKATKQLLECEWRVAVLGIQRLDQHAPEQETLFGSTTLEQRS